MMDTRELERFAALLRDRLAELDVVEDANKEARATVELDQQSVGRLARMDALERQSMALATQRRRVAERRKIAAAFKRIDEDEFGYCETCGEPISIGRLELDPTVVKCVDCAS